MEMGEGMATEGGKGMIEEMKISELMKELSKRVKETDKKNKELTKLVCFLRREFDYAVKQKNGIIEEFDFESKNMQRAFDIMMGVEHDREMAKRERAMNKYVAEQEAKAEKENAVAEDGEMVI